MIKTAQRRHSQGLQVLDHVIKDKSWSILTDNGIKDDQFFADAKVCLRFVRDFHRQYGAFPPRELVCSEAKISFPSEVPAAYAVDSFNDYQLSKELQNIAKCFGDLAVSDPKKCLAQIRSDITQIEYTNTVNSFKSTADLRFERYIKEASEPLKGVVPAWQGMSDAFSVYEDGTLNVILGITSTGKCLEENTLCTTGDGTRKTIKEIVEQKLDIYSIDPDTGDFTLKTPKDWFYSGEKECLQLKFKTKDTLTQSLDHPILTGNGWVKAGDLKAGDTIARVGRIPAPKKALPSVNNDEIAVIAALLADGDISRRESTKYTKKDKKLIQFMKKTCKNLDIEFYKTPSQQIDDALNWTLRAPKIARVLRRHKIPAAKSEFKCLPRHFLQLPNKNLRTFVSVFFSHDGTVSVSNNKLSLGISQSSESLIDDLRHMMLRFGVFSIKSHSKTELNTDLYSLRIPVQEHKKFLSRFDILREEVAPFKIKGEKYIGKHRIENKKLLHCSNIFWDEVKEIKPVGKKRTYDLSVADTHSFEAGYTHVHNSWLSCITAQDAAFHQGKKVLLVSMENTKRSMEDRLEAYYHKLPFGDLKKGLIDFRTEKYWQENVSKVHEEEGDIWVVGSDIVKNVADLEYQIASISPDFTIIDGGYKLASGRGSLGYEKSSEVLQAIEDCAKVFDIPILATSQLNEAAQKAVGGRQVAFEARFNKEWLMNPTSVCCLTQDADDLIFNRVKCTIAKSRDAGDTTGVSQEFYIKSDRIRMDFSQVTDEYLDQEGLDSLF